MANCVMLGRSGGDAEQAGNKVSLANGVALRQPSHSSLVIAIVGGKLLDAVFIELSGWTMIAGEDNDEHLAAREVI